MKTFPRFYVHKECEFCKIINDHYVDFELYLIKEDKVIYRITCEHCYTMAKRRPDKIYNYIRMTCTSAQWNNFIPKTIQILN